MEKKSPQLQRPVPGMISTFFLFVAAALLMVNFFLFNTPMPSGRGDIRIDVFANDTGAPVVFILKRGVFKSLDQTGKVLARRRVEYDSIVLHGDRMEIFLDNTGAFFEKFGKKQLSQKVLVSKGKIASTAAWQGKTVLARKDVGSVTFLELDGSDTSPVSNFRIDSEIQKVALAADRKGLLAAFRIPTFDTIHLKRRGAEQPDTAALNVPEGDFSVFHNQEKAYLVFIRRKNSESFLYLVDLTDKGREVEIKTDWLESTVSAQGYIDSSGKLWMYRYNGVNVFRQTLDPETGQLGKEETLKPQMTEKPRDSAEKWVLAMFPIFTTLVILFLAYKRPAVSLSPRDPTIRIAPVYKRVGAILVDMFLIRNVLRIFVITSDIRMPELPEFGAAPPVEWQHLIVWGLLLMFIYFTLLEGLWGATVGKRLLGMRVVAKDADFTGKAPFTSILLRNILRFPEIYVCLMGLAFMLITRQNQRVGDIISKTVVIDTPLLPFTLPQPEKKS